VRLFGFGESTRECVKACPFRIWRIKKGRAVSLRLPSVKTAQDVVAAVGVVADAVGAGEPDEGQAMSVILEAKRKAIETVELESRVAALEQDRKR